MADVASLPQSGNLQNIKLFAIIGLYYQGEASMVDKHLEDEFYTACPIMPENAEFIKMKVMTDRGQTTTFDITPEQFRMVEKVLVYGYNVKKPV